MSRSIRTFILLVVSSWITLPVFAGGGYSGLNEKLGYAPTDRLLIIHADDAGIAHSVNKATFSALDSGRVTSASVMVPCPWLLEVADYAKRNPHADIGVHLTLSSEWLSFKWGPVASKSEVPSLVDPLGYFYTIREALALIDPREAEIELREQVKMARAAGMEPTHLDTHQLLAYFRPGLFEAYLKVGRESGIPVLISRSVFELIRTQLGENSPDWDSYLEPGDILIDKILSISPAEAEAGWPAFYEKAVKGLQPGVTEIIVHVGFDSEELLGMAGNEAFGSSWRQKEFDYLMGEEFGNLLKQENVKQVTWREIGRAYRQENK